MKNNDKDLIWLNAYVSLTRCPLFWVRDIFQEPLPSPRLYLQVIHHRAPQGSGVPAASMNKCLRALYYQAK